MPASKTQLEKPNFPNVKKLGIIAGGGVLPEKLAQCCEDRGIEVFIVAFSDQTRSAAVAGREHIWSSIGAAGKIIKTLKSHCIQDLVLIGNIKRPGLADLKPDLKTAEFFARVGLRALGDNNILELLKSELAREGFQVHGIQNFMQDILTKPGAVGQFKPSKKQDETIRRGVDIARGIGQLDVGQSVIVQGGIVLGVEAAEGTDELIRRCKAYQRKGDGPILVKMCKPHQDKYLDLPTIGPDTVLIAVENGLSGIIIEAGNSLLIEPEEVAKIANRHKIFVYGFSTPITD